MLWNWNTPEVTLNPLEVSLGMLETNMPSTTLDGRLSRKKHPTKTHPSDTATRERKENQPPNSPEIWTMCLNSGCGIRRKRCPPSNTNPGVVALCRVRCLCNATFRMNECIGDTKLGEKQMSLAFDNARLSKPNTSKHIQKVMNYVPQLFPRLAVGSHCVAKAAVFGIPLTNLPRCHYMDSQAHQNKDLRRWWCHSHQPRLFFNNSWVLLGERLHSTAKLAAECWWKAEFLDS